MSVKFSRPKNVSARKVWTNDSGYSGAASTVGEPIYNFFLFKEIIVTATDFSMVMTVFILQYYREKSTEVQPKQGRVSSCTCRPVAMQTTTIATLQRFRVQRNAGSGWGTAAWFWYQCVQCTCQSNIVADPNSTKCSRL